MAVPTQAPDNVVFCVSVPPAAAVVQPGFNTPIPVVASPQSTTFVPQSTTDALTRTILKQVITPDPGVYNG